jgi:hypothetical protein
MDKNNEKYKNIYTKIDELLQSMEDLYHQQQNDGTTKYINLCFNTILNDLQSMKSFVKALEFKDSNGAISS